MHLCKKLQAEDWQTDQSHLACFIQWYCLSWRAIQRQSGYLPSRELTVDFGVR